MRYDRFCYVLTGLALFCGVFISCSSADENELQTILIPKKTDPELKLEQLTKSLKLIQLETNEKSLLTDVLDIKLFNEKIYVSDASKRILIFDQEGKFIKVLGKRGEGPGEYEFFPHIAIDEESNLLYVASAMKLFVYSKEDELILENSLPFNVYAFSVLEDKLFLLRQELSIPQEEGYLNRASFYEINKSLDLVDTIPFREVKLKSSSASDFPLKNYFSTVGTDHFVYVPDFGSQIILHDTLYQFKEKALTPFLKLNFETKQVLDKGGMKKIQIYNVVNSLSYVLCEYYSESKYMIFIYDKKNATGYNLQKGVLDGNGNPVVLRPLDLGRNIFYFVQQSKYSDRETEEQNPSIGIVQLK